MENANGITLKIILIEKQFYVNFKSLLCVLFPYKCSRDIGVNEEI